MGTGSGYGEGSSHAEEGTEEAVMTATKEVPGRNEVGKLQWLAKICSDFRGTSMSLMKQC